MSDKGFITLDRKILDWEWFTDGNMLKLWIYLLETANYEDGYYRGRKIKRGQVVVGRKMLADKLKMSEQSVRTCINRLKSTNEITTETTNKDTLITIIKYNEYQDKKKKSTNKITNKLTNEQPTTNQQLTTSKEIKEINNLNKYIYKGNEFVDVFNDFKEMRKKIKKPLTERAEQLIINKLDKISSNVQIQIEILNQSILNGWLDVYPLKNKRQDIITTYDTTKNPEYDEERFNEIMQRRKNVS